MKQVLRSTLDPLPRSLSTPGLISLVSVVVLGTAVTVFRYMESSGHPRPQVYGQGTTQSIGSRIEVRGNSDGPRAHSLGTGRTGGLGCTATGSSSTGGCGSQPASVEPTSAAPSAFEPE